MIRYVSVLLLLSGCAVNQVSVKGEMGDEIRPEDNRESISVGLETKMENDVKFSVKYRFRTTDFQSNSREHGVFVGVCAPLWKKKGVKNETY